MASSSGSVPFTLENQSAGSLSGEQVENSGQPARASITSERIENPQNFVISRSISPVEEGSSGTSEQEKPTHGATQIQARGLEQSNRELWSPFFLRRLTISVFIAVFVAVLVTVISLFIASNKHNGLTSVNSKDYYLWTYGPTAAFVLIGAFWGQVQYRATQLMPWLLMSHGFAPASKTILLDYISPWNVVSLFKASRQKHFLVVLAVAGMLLIKLAAVFSTALFSVSTIEVATRQSFTVTTELGGSVNWTLPSLTAFNMLPVAAAFGINQLNMSPPVGISANHAFQVFQDEDLVDGYAFNKTYQAVVDVLTTELTCEDATATSAVQVPRTDIHIAQTIVTFNSCECSFNITFQPTSGDGFNAALLPCEQASGTLEPSGDQCDTAHNDSQLLVAVSYLDPGSPFEVVEDDDWSNPAPTLAGRSFVALACKPSYQTNRGRVTIQRDLSTGLPDSEATLLEPISKADFSNVTGEDILTLAYCTTYWMSEDGGQAFLPANLAKSTSDQLSQLRNSTLLRSRVQDTVGSLMIQSAKSFMISDSNSTVEGVIMSPQTRLVIRPVSFGLLLGTISLLIVVSSILLLRYAPCKVCSRDPGSIGGIATIFARSHSSSKSLQGASLIPTRALSQHLINSEYRAKTDRTTTYAIESLEDDLTNLKATAQEGEIHWRRPFSLTPVSFGITLLLSVSAIVVLEVLLHVSRKSQGFANVNSQSYIRYSWTYAPTLLMQGLLSLYEMLYSAVRVLQPYHDLRQGRAPKSAIMENYHRKIGLWALMDSILNRHWRIAYAVIPVLLAAFSPVAVSSLYSPSSTTQPNLVNVTRLDLFNLTSPGTEYYTDPLSGTNGQQGLENYIAGFVLTLNMSDPQWTYGPYALPLIEVHSPDSLANESVVQSSLSIQLPAVYANMNCSELPSNQYAVDDLAISNQTFDSCNSTFPSYSAILSSGIPFTNGTYWASMQYPDTVTMDEHCPVFLFFFGTIESENDLASGPITAIQCSPRIESVDLKVTLSIPSYQIDHSRPPVPIEGTQKTLYSRYFYISMSSSESSSAEVVPILDFLENLLLYNNLNPTTNFRMLDGGDPAFGQTLIAVHDPDELTRSPSALIEAVQRVYGVVVAQTINVGGRSPYSTNVTAEAAAPSIITGTLVAPGHDRLQQSVISTRILQGLLAAMILCAILTILFTPKIVRTVPNNPYTIASVWSLLAGSRMLEEDVILPRAEWCGDKQLKEIGVFEGRTFTLGWWDEKGTGADSGYEKTRSFRIDVDDTDEE